MIKLGGTHGSGSYTYLSGWFNVLFPFSGSGERNVYCCPYSMHRHYVKQALEAFHNDDYGCDKDCTHGGLDASKFPRGLASAPVKWEADGTGTTQDNE